MEYIVEQRLPAWVLRFDGDLGSHDEGDLRTMFVRLRREEETNVVADMRKVQFLDSRVLGTLVWGMRNLREAGGDFRLFGLQDFVRKLFDITQLDRAFRVFATEEEAVRSYR